MANRYILVLDAGTSRARCHLFDHNAQVIASAEKPWEFVKDESSSLALSFNPDVLWKTFCELIQRCLKEAQVNPKNVSAITATSQRQGIAFLDKNGQEIYVGPNLDLRAVFEGAAIDDENGDVIYKTTGHLPSFLFAAAKLKWFQAHQPKAYENIAHVLTLADWIVWQLTGEVVSEPTLAAEAGLLDIHKRVWCRSLLENLGVFSSDVPLLESGNMVGGVSSVAAASTGLTEGTPVAIAGADTQCGLLGLGVFNEHQVGVVAGWSIPVQMVTATPVLSPEGKTWAGCFLEHNKWVLESTSGDAGNSYQWLADTIFEEQSDPFEKMNSLANNVPTGSEDAFAFIGPSRMDMTKLGMKSGGFIFPVPLTFSELGKGHLVRATLEGVAYSIRANLEQIEGLSGVLATDIAVGGGMTRSSTFVRILVDVLGREINVSDNPDVSAVGAYLCASTALGEFSSLREAAMSVRSSQQKILPDPLNQAEYNDYYERWQQVNQELQGLGL